MKNHLLNHVKFNLDSEGGTEVLCTHVVVLIMHNEVLFGGLNDQQEVMTIRYGTPKKDVVYAEYEFIRHEIINEPLLADPEVKVTVILHDKRQMPMPAGAFTAEESWLDTIHYCLPMEEQLHYSMKGGLDIGYLYNKDLQQLVNQFIPQAEIIPFAALLLLPTDETEIRLSICGKYFWVSFMHHQKLNQWHVERFTHTNDIAYTLHYILKKGGLPPYLNIYGMACCEQDVKIFEQLKNFFPHLTIGSQSDRAIYTEWLPVVRLLEKAAQCAS